MKNYRVIIVDDEHMASVTLQSYIKEYCFNLSVIAIAQGGEEGYRKILELAPDLVFLDIQMPRIDGFEMLKMFTEIKFDIIFCTAYNVFAIKAFKYSAFDYLLKPIGISELKETVNRYVLQKEKSRMFKNTKLELLLSNIENKIEYILVPEIDGFTRIKIIDIVLFKSDYGYTHIFCKNNLKVTSSKSLKYFKDLLNENSLFYEIGKSNLVNINYISKYKKDGILTLLNNIEIVVPRRKRKDFISVLQDVF